MLVLKNSEGEVLLDVLVGSRFRLPDGSIVSPAYDGWSQNGYSLEEAPPVVDEQPLPTGDDVNKERDLRVQAGAAFNLEGHLPKVPISGDDNSRENLTNLGLLAQSMIASGSTSPIPFRDRNNLIHQLSPQQVVELWQKGVMRVSAIYEASWALKDRPEGIPMDYREDVYWPE